MVAGRTETVTFRKRLEVSRKPEEERKPFPQGDGVVRVSRETQGRKGKGVTLVRGVPLDRDGLRGLAKELKQTCGSGGTVKEGVIEIQGDHRDALMEALRKKGYNVRRSGG